MGQLSGRQIETVLARIFCASVCIGLLAILSGCAGPTTPFGPLSESEAVKKKKAAWKAVDQSLKLVTKVERKLEEPTIDFNPTRQVLHGPTNFKVRIRDPLGVPPEHRVVVLHNGYDVSPAFRSRARKKVLPGNSEIELSFRTLRTPPTQEHDIEIYYFRDGNLSKPEAHAEFLAPTCKPFDMNQVAHTGTFFVPKKMLYMIERVSRDGNYSPSFVTALIAQESGFRNSALSWAKAIGMTQVTPPAETMIINDFPDFPQYPGLNEMSVPRIKALISAGIVNGSNEWRLDDEMGVRGGVAYLGYVRDYWSTPNNEALIREHMQDFDIGLSKVILASYNSGPYRVKKALQKHGSRWLFADNLGEARKYVHRIFSYCYHFSHPKKVIEEKESTNKNVASKKETELNNAEET